LRTITIHGDLADRLTSAGGETMALRALTCPNCGASLSVESGATTTTCSYCDTTVEVGQAKGKTSSEDLFPEFRQNQVSCPSCGKAGLRPRIRTADFRCGSCGAVHDREVIERLSKRVGLKNSLDRLKYALEGIKKTLISSNPPPNPYLVTTKAVDRPEPSEDERAEALSVVLETFPPDITTELIARNMHPHDLGELARLVRAAKGPPAPKDSGRSGCLVFAVSLGPAYGVFRLLDDSGLAWRIGAGLAVMVVVFVVGAQVADRLTGEHQRLLAQTHRQEEHRQAAAALVAWCEAHPLLAPGGDSIERDRSDPIYFVVHDLEREKRLLHEMRRLEYVEAILTTYAAEPERREGLEVVAQIRALEETLRSQ
jgi:ribosomal protein L37AE/L43A